MCPMVHLFVFAEGREPYMSNFIGDLKKRSYSYNRTDGGMGWLQCNPREIKLLDISVPKEALPTLLSDLSPFAYRAKNTVSDQKDKAALLAKTLRLAGNMKAIYPEFDEPVKWKEIPTIFSSLSFIKKIARVPLIGRILKHWKEKEVRKAKFIGRYLDLLARFFRPDVPEEEYKSSGEVRKMWVNVMPIGYKEDWYNPDALWSGLPKGGEMI